MNINSLTSLARPSLLAILCGGAIAVFAHALFTKPTRANLQQPTNFAFLATVPVVDNKLVASQSLPAHTFPNGMVAPGHSYHYQQGDRSIEIQLRYIADGVSNRPTMDELLPKLANIPKTVLTPATLKEKPGVGFYSTFVENKKAYLGTCIPPRGVTSVTGDQFHNNTNPANTGIPFDRVMPWLLGRQTLRDSRCLWTLLSTPIDSAAPDATMKVLESVGLNWIRWWQNNFPST